ncbi:ELMO domain-containing protein B [Phytophthora cinnamomi]|uniref:ELMO domain-containing protein B n=1 Tax=Phytophthora cinnamomi TaxID=4785 RepID=UPI003559C492|nr:ELMO domain-containing protein B [Phytophthora cinnamomi]
MDSIDPSVFAALPHDIQEELLALQGAPAPRADVEPPADAWSCRVCTFLNHPQLAECEMCGTLCVALDDDDELQAPPPSPASNNNNYNNSGSRLGRTLRRLRVPATPATVSFSQKREPTAEDLLLAASSKLQLVRQSWQGRRSRANSAVEDRAALPSLQALRELTELQKDLHHKVQAGDEWFEASLERLWRAVGDAGNEQVYERSGVDWVALGFQNASPETDFRGGGVLAMKCLLYAFEAHPAEMRAIQMEQTPDSMDDKHKKRWYPVCVAGINLTCLLAGLLQLGDGRFAERKETFWQLFEEPAAFYELFFLAFIKMHAIWHRLNATYMEFGVVLKVTRKSVVFMLEQAPATLMDLRAASDQAFLDRFVCLSPPLS